MDKKHLELLDFLLVELCKSQSGTMFRHILTDYKQLTNIEFNYDEKNNFISLYENIYFTKENIDRLKITQSARQIINDHGSLTQHLKLQERQEQEKQKTVLIIQSSSKKPKPKSNINKLAANPIIQILTIIVMIYSFLKIIEVVFCINIPII